MDKRDALRYRIAPLEMTPSEFRKVGRQLVERIAELIGMEVLHDSFVSARHVYENGNEGHAFRDVPDRVRGAEAGQLQF